MPAEHPVDPRPAAPLSSLPHLLEHHAKRIPEAPAILAPGRPPLSYGHLYQHIDQIGCTLRGMGIGRHDRVGVLLPNGPEMAVAVLATAASAVCAPINPAYGLDELNTYFADLRPYALITEAGIASPARQVALARAIRVIELSTALDAEAGLFTVTGDPKGAPFHEAFNPDDVAMLLPTSGTTSRPKIVPLTHANICASAFAAGKALALTENDRCLNILPLFFGHGINATIMTSLAAGASIVCTPGYDASRFFDWLTAFRPTWYSAVPTMHQAILAEAHRYERATDYCFRFIRSGSAPLPPRIFAELEQTFDCPVIEFYGMTEVASAPVACNPLPPCQRKAGSVGLPVDLDVAILDEESGAFLPTGQTGHIVVRGSSLMSGYDGNPAATEDAFAGDWFKTGDQGLFDGDGYLYLVGRSKEIINRGGEKVAPREVDDVLLEHPAVAEAATFAVPHPTLGEDVAAVIVLRAGVAATPTDIRQFISRRVANFKVPRQVLIVSEIPKGPTGKVARIGLAAKLGLASPEANPSAFVAPRTPLEKVLAGLWAELLQVERVGIHDDFFSLGGDSLLVTAVLASVHELMKIDLDLSRFFEGPTVAETAHHINMLIQVGQASQSSSPIVRAPRVDGVPASLAQERLCRLQRALPDVPFFNILYVLRVTSAVDVAILERGVNEIVRRHDILRTTFAVIDGRYVQVIAPQLIVCLTIDDLRALPESKKETVGYRIVQEEALHNFDLSQGSLFRARLLHLAEREHLLLITMHQVIGDGWSLGVFADELLNLYDAFSAQAASPLAPLPIQYADFAYRQRHWQSHPDILAQLEYWREQLRDPLPAMQLAAAGSRSTIEGLCTARREVALPANLAEAAKRFANRDGGTLFMALLAALKTLLHCYLSQEDLRVATLVANRNRPGTEGLIGPLVNTLILRTHLRGDPSPRELMHRVRATTLAAFAHQDLPFEELAEVVLRERAVEPASLARVMIVLQNATLRPIATSGHALAFEEANPNALMPLVTITTFDIILMLHESIDGLVGSCVYKPRLFDAATIDHLLRDFQSVLEQMVTQPDRPISAIRIPTNERLSMV
jgi:acyl-CoA synthetase (AMP-forming)/AMP-acid ligase II